MNGFELLHFLDDLELDIFLLEDITKNSGKSSQEIHRKLDFLVKKDLLNRLEKGKYCRHTFRNEYVIGYYLSSGGVVSYWSALNFYGLTEQFPNVVFVQSAKLKQSKTVFGVKYNFVKVKSEKLMGAVWQGVGNHRFLITDLEKTLIDCFDLPQYSGGYFELLRAFSEANLNCEKLILYAQQVNNISLIKRIAYLIEVLEKAGLSPFVAFALPYVNQKYTLFDPFGEDKGKFVARWHLRMNIDEAAILALVQKKY